MPVPSQFFVPPPLWRLLIIVVAIRKMGSLVKQYQEAEAVRTTVIRKWFNEYTQLVGRWNTFVSTRDAVECSQALDTSLDFKAFMVPRYSQRELTLVRADECSQMCSQMCIHTHKHKTHKPLDLGTPLMHSSEEPLARFNELNSLAHRRAFPLHLANVPSLTVSWSRLLPRGLQAAFTDPYYDALRDGRLHPAGTRT